MSHRIAVALSPLARTGLALAATLALAAPAGAQETSSFAETNVPTERTADRSMERAPARPADAPKPSRTRTRAERDASLRVVVSLDDRRLWVISQQDTLMEAPVAVGSGLQVSGLRRTWRFETPRGVRRVMRKKTDPVWNPPDWLYVEVAQENGLKVERLAAGRARRLSDGRRLVTRDDRVWLVDTDGSSVPMNLDEHIVFDETLFVPPAGTKNRRIEGELGRFALDTGDGYMLHGTPFEDTVGQKASHGCLRLKDADIAWLYENVPVGTRVYLY